MGQFEKEAEKQKGLVTHVRNAFRNQIRIFITTRTGYEQKFCFNFKNEFQVNVIT